MSKSRPRSHVGPKGPEDLKDNPNWNWKANLWLLAAAACDTGAFFLCGTDMLDGWDFTMMCALTSLSGFSDTMSVANSSYPSDVDTQDLDDDFYNLDGPDVEEKGCGSRLVSWMKDVSCTSLLTKVGLMAVVGGGAGIAGKKIADAITQEAAKSILSDPSIIPALGAGATAMTAAMQTYEGGREASIRCRKK